MCKSCSRRSREQLLLLECPPNFPSELKKLELLSATPQATLAHLSCSPSFPSASYLDERTADVKLILTM